MHTLIQVAIRTTMLSFVILKLITLAKSYMSSFLYLVVNSFISDARRFEQTERSHSQLVTRIVAIILNVYANGVVKVFVCIIQLLSGVLNIEVSWGSLSHLFFHVSRGTVVALSLK